MKCMARAAGDLVQKKSVCSGIRFSFGKTKDLQIQEATKVLIVFRHRISLNSEGNPSSMKVYGSIWYNLCSVCLQLGAYLQQYLYIYGFSPHKVVDGTHPLKSLQISISPCPYLRHSWNHLRDAKFHQWMAKSIETHSWSKLCTSDTDMALTTCQCKC